MASICSPEMPRRAFMAVIAGGLLAAPLAAEDAEHRKQIKEWEASFGGRPITKRTDMYPGQDRG